MKKNFKFICLSAFLLIFSSCNSDDDSSGGGPGEPSLNLQKIEGRYIGVLTSNLTTFSVSAKIRKVTDNEYSVELYETATLVPAHNSDGVTPEVTGNLIKEGSIFNANLTLSSDSPICTGEYIGSGPRNNSLGRFNLNMDYEETCNGQDFSGSFQYRLTKNGEL